MSEHISDNFGLGEGITNGIEIEGKAIGVLRQAQDPLCHRVKPSISLQNRSKEAKPGSGSLGH